jgi:hypothetical protein
MASGPSSSIPRKPLTRCCAAFSSLTRPSLIRSMLGF